jgi:aspartate oxidase
MCRLFRVNSRDHSVQRLIVGALSHQKFFIRFARQPVVDSEVHQRFPRVAEEMTSRKVRVAPKQGIPVTPGA